MVLVGVEGAEFDVFFIVLFVEFVFFKSVFYIIYIRVIWDVY